MKKTLLFLVTLLFAASAWAQNTIESSTMTFEGDLTESSGEYSGTIMLSQAFDNYAMIGSTVVSSASNINGQQVGDGHDAYPNWDPDVPDDTWYALHLDGTTDTWELWYLNTENDPTSGAAYTPLAGDVFWTNSYASEDGQNWTETWAGHGFEDIKYAFPGFTLDITDNGSGNYTVKLIPAAVPTGVSVEPLGPVVNNNSGESFGTIQAAIDAATVGDVIEVAAGTYNEFVDVSKELTILGANAGVDPNTDTRTAESIIDYNGDYAVEIFASNVTFDGFSVSNNLGNAVRISVGRNTSGIVNAVTVKNNIATGSAILSCPTCTGLYMGVMSFDNFELSTYTSQNIAFTNNLITVSETNGRGITMSAYNDSQLTGSIAISDNHILTSGSPTSTAGIELRSTSGNTSMQNVAVSKNTIDGFDIGGVWVRLNPTANISENLFGGNVANTYDIRLDHDPANNNNVIVHNSFSGSTAAVRNNTTAVVDATCNWWGTTDSELIPTKILGPVTWFPFWVSDEGPCLQKMFEMKVGN